MNIFFADSLSTIKNAALLPTLSGSVSGVGYSVDANTPPQYATNINSVGSNTMAGLGRYAAQWAQGHDADNNPCSGYWASLQSTIATSIADGFYVNEPINVAPTNGDTR